MRARFLRFVSLVIGGAMGVSGLAWAATSNEPIVLSNDFALARPAAEAPSPAIPVAAANAADTTPLSGEGALLSPAPTAPWSIKRANVPADLVAQGQKIPCIATRTEENGGVLRLSGGGQKLTGIWMIGKDLKLTPKQTVPVALSFGKGGPVIPAMGLAAAANSLIIDIKGVEGLYQNIANANALSVTVGQSAMNFSLAGSRGALSQLETCYANVDKPGPKKADITTSAGLGQQMQMASAAKALAAIEPAAGTIPSATGPLIPMPGETPMATPAAQTGRAGASPSLTISQEPFIPTAPSMATPPVVATASPDAAARRVELSRVREQELTRLNSNVSRFGSGDVTAPPLMVPASAAGPAPTAPKPMAAIPVVAAATAPVVAIAPPIVTPAAASASAPVRVSVEGGNILIPANKNIVDTYRARKGEGLRAVMRRWSGRAGIDLVWNLPSDVTLSRDYSFVGDFKSALDALLRDYPQAGITTTYINRGITPATPAPQPYIAESQPPALPPVPVQTGELDDFIPPLPPESLSDLAPSASASAPAASALPVAGPSKRWRALQGASMREVLRAWADEAGVSFVWQVGTDYAVRESYNRTTDYAQAVNQLLEQYRDQPARPVGHLYQDPTTGKKALVVRREG